jgi:hypothetical protein
MIHMYRRPAAAAAAVFALVATLPGAIATMQPSGVAKADVCATANGQRVYASGCVDVAGGVDYYAPPPEYYAPLPQDFDPLPNVTACVGCDGTTWTCHRERLHLGTTHSPLWTNTASSLLLRAGPVGPSGDGFFAAVQS